MDYLQDGQRRDIHRVLAERALEKPLPKGAEVHHIDGNKHNNDPSNLIICPNSAYHKLLHLRQVIINAGGNPNEERFCCSCKTCKAKNQFYKNKARQDGITNICRDCFSVQYKFRKIRRLVAAGI